MGNYGGELGEKFKGGHSLNNALETFGADIVKASEIEWINLEKFKKSNFNFPISFFIINLTIDKLLESMKEHIPERVPPFKEYKTKRK